MANVDDYFIQYKITECVKCGRPVVYLGNGTFKCTKCAKIQTDLYGRVLAYIRENPECTVDDVAFETQANRKVISDLFDMGKHLEDNSKYFAECTKCGVSIEKGRFCMNCSRNLANDIGNIFKEEDRAKRFRMLTRGAGLGDDGDRGKYRYLR